MSQTAPVRIAMWSGPRNISTTMMRSFGNRADTSVSDEPFYAAYLAATGLDHPLREEILAAQPQDWRVVAEELVGPVPAGRAVWYQKHMTHHLARGFGREWIDRVVNVFLLRAPEAVLASYVAKREDVTLEDIGVPQQVALFDRVADRLGAAPTVVEAQDILANPATMIALICARCGIAFDPAMLQWPKGRRATDGVWAPAWYDQVEQSTGFGPVRREIDEATLDDRLKPIADAARPAYEKLRAHRLQASSAS